MKQPYILPEKLAVDHTCYPDRTVTYTEGMERPVLLNLAPVAKKAYKDEADRVRKLQRQMKLVKKVG